MGKRLIFSHEAASDADYYNQFGLGMDEDKLTGGVSHDPIIDGAELRHNQDDPTCWICRYTMTDETVIVITKWGLAHEECAENYFEYDPGDTRWPR